MLRPIPTPTPVPISTPPPRRKQTRTMGYMVIRTAFIQIERGLYRSSSLKESGVVAWYITTVSTTRGRLLSRQVDWVTGGSVSKQQLNSTTQL